MQGLRITSACYCCVYYWHNNNSMGHQDGPASLSYRAIALYVCVEARALSRLMVAGGWLFHEGNTKDERYNSDIRCSNTSTDESIYRETADETAKAFCNGWADKCVPLSALLLRTVNRQCLGKCSPSRGSGSGFHQRRLILSSNRITGAVV